MWNLQLLHDADYDTIPWFLNFSFFDLGTTVLE